MASLLSVFSINTIRVPLAALFSLNAPQKAADQVRDVKHIGIRVATPGEPYRIEKRYEVWVIPVQQATVTQHPSRRYLKCTVDLPRECNHRPDRRFHVYLQCGTVVLTCFFPSQIPSDYSHARIVSLSALGNG